MNSFDLSICFSYWLEDFFLAFGFFFGLRWQQYIGSSSAQGSFLIWASCLGAKTKEWLPSNDNRETSPWASWAWNIVYLNYIFFVFQTDTLPLIHTFLFKWPFLFLFFLLTFESISRVFVPARGILWKLYGSLEWGILHPSGQIVKMSIHYREYCSSSFCHWIAFCSTAVSQGRLDIV